jgi:PBSX family phage terminase large subunit
MRPPELDAKINILVGSVRSGKTFALHSKILYLCDYDVGGRKLLTGVSKSSIKTNVLHDLADLIGPRHYDYNAQSGELRLFDSHWTVIGAKDEGSEKYVRGSTVGAAVCDELTLMPLSFFQTLLTRLSPPGARLYASTNVDVPTHWLKKQYLDNEELIEAGKLWTDVYTMVDNPNLNAEYVEDQKKLYTGAFYQRAILAKWSMSEGACYAEAWGPWTMYDAAPVGLYGAGGHDQHLIGVDYGTVNPMVFLDCGDDGKTLWFDNEWYWDSKKKHRQKTDQEYVADLKEFIAASNFKRTEPKVLVDPSAASFIEACRRDGSIWLAECDNTVNDGIRRFASGLQQRKVRFNKRCKESEREFQGYVWDPDAAKRGEEKPLKVDDHTCDAGRYVGNDVFKYDWRLSA